MKKRRAGLPGMLVQELARVTTQPWFWVSVAGCIVLRMLCTFGVSDTYDLVFVQGSRDSSLINILYINRWGSFLSYVPYCLCAFPFVGSFIQDEGLNRLEFMVPRSGCLNYAAAQVAVVFLGASFCMFIGDAVFILVGHFGLGMPFGTDSFTSSSLLEGGHSLGFWLATELQVCMQAVFYASYFTDQEDGPLEDAVCPFWVVKYWDGEWAKQIVFDAYTGKYLSSGDGDAY